MKLWNRSNEPERKAWHAYEKDDHRERIKSSVKTAVKTVAAFVIAVYAITFIMDQMNAWQMQDSMREAESKLQISTGIKDPSQSSHYQGNTSISGDKNTDAIRVQKPMPTVTDLERWGEPIRSTYIMEYGYTPSPTLLYLYGIEEAYDSTGEAIDMDVTPTATWLVTHVIYADPEMTKQYIWYDGALYLLEDGKDVVAVK